MNPTAEVGRAVPARRHAWNVEWCAEDCAPYLPVHGKVGKKNQKSKIKN
jgi:hypothetical protein